MKIANNEQKSEMEKTYLLLKREIYYEKIDLFLRAKFAAFDYDEKLVETELNNINNFLIKMDLNDTWFTSQLESIHTNFLPKKVKTTYPIDEKDSQGYITNLRTQDNYPVEEINYFFTGNIPLYILSLFWTTHVGILLDNELSDDCYGNRLDINTGKDVLNNDYRAFKIYINQYNDWRDKAIQTSLHLLESQNDALLISLDFKQCFYHLDVNWSEIDKFVQKNSKENYQLFKFLTAVIQKIHEKYCIKTKDFLSKTHQITEKPFSTETIPIGLPSSRVLANWELKKFDLNVKENLRPVYYGRYVDDILLVINNPNSEVVKQGTTETLKNYLVKTSILSDKDNNKKVKLKKIDGKFENAYKVKGYCDLYIQNSKIIVHYYDHRHSWAGIKEFMEELKHRSSEFRFLPEEDQYKDLVDEAYDIRYDGSVYRFRSLIGINENATKLSQFLYKQQLKCWLSTEKTRDKTINEIFQFYKGRNFFDYCRLWEKVFTLLLSSQRYNEFINFANESKKVIEKISFPNDLICEKIKSDFNNYREIAICMSIGLLPNQIKGKDYPKKFVVFLSKFLTQDNNAESVTDFPDDSLPMIFRKTNLLYHQNLAWPLLDYSDYTGDLTNLKIESIKQISIDEKKVDKSTRFLQLDELLQFLYLQKIILLNSTNQLQNKKMIDSFSYVDTQLSSNEPLYLQKKINSLLNQNVEIKKQENAELSTTSIKITSKREKNKQFCVGVVNMKVDANNIDAAYNPRKRPNTSYDRQKELFNLINQGLKKPTCDLLVFPEVSIPFSWLPFMVSQSRKSDMGFVFGLEHIVSGDYALNLVATLLPYHNEDSFHNVFFSLRLKNHYSPMEKHLLSGFNLERPDYPCLYEKFSWRGCVFPVYNCYELTDILHRGLFRSDIDLLVATEYNPDVNYFSNIIEAATRDIHCYSIQANSSDYGDSRVISPEMTERMNLIRVKGGENAVLIKTFLDIEKLRDFQSREFSPILNDFKPTPAGYDHRNARKRN
jgi:hypothetical protein